MKTICSFALFCLLSPGATAAPSEPPGDMLAMSSLLKKNLAELVDIEVSITTGTPKLLKNAPSVATVITAQDIEDMGAATLDEILETVPGLHVQPGGANIFSSIWTIRGIYTQLNPQVLLLIDGLPLRLNTNGTKPYRLRMPVSMISRIEIIRGPGSAVLGADAFAGAINVITKESSEISGSNLGFIGGSFGSYDLWAQHGGTYNGWNIAIGAEYSKGDGDGKRIIEKDALGSGPPSLAPGPLDTHYETLTSSLTLHKDKFTFKLHNIWMMDNGIGAGITNVLNDGKSDTNYYTLLGSLSYLEKDLLRDFDLTSTLNGTFLWLENTFYFFPESYRRMIGQPGTRELSGGLELAGDYRGLENHKLRALLGFDNYYVDPFQHKNFGPGIPVQFGPLVDITNTPYVYMTDQHRRLFHTGIQDEWKFAQNWELTAGIRYDDYSDFGSALSPRLALVWNATPDLITKILYGRAFRAPTFGEMHTQNNPATIGNTNLDAETIDTYELAFDYRPGKAVRLGLNLFTYRIDGLIDYVADPAPATTRTAQNARDQKGQGFEIETEWVATETLRLLANFSYQRSKDKKSDSVVPDVPEMKIYANAHWKFLPDWSLDGQYFRVMNRHRAAGDPRPEIKDYDLVNMTLRRKNIARHWDFAVSVRNLFNNDVREPAPPAIPGDYPMEHRSLWAEMRYSF